jgi:hypothetical protein
MAFPAGLTRGNGGPCPRRKAPVKQRPRFFQRIIQEAERPPDDSRPRLRLMKAPTVGRLTVVSLSPRVYQYLTHWDPDENRTRPCSNPTGKGECPWCDLPQRWKGYVAGFNPSNRAVYLLELTSGAYRHCQKIRDGGADLRGSILIVTRLKGQANAPARVELGGRVDATALPPEPDVSLALHRLWGIAADLGDGKKGGAS